MENIGFKADSKFKLAVDLAITKRRSTLRREATLALCERLGIAIPANFEEKPEESPDAAA
jgi:hypothetical protein